MNYNRVMTVAGTDPTGGAGIQADIKAISACGCFATSAITAVLAQNTMGVTAIQPIPDDMIRKQIVAILEDVGTNAVKIGMLHSSETIKTVHQALKDFNITNIVLDPVMVATSGDPLLEESAVNALKEILIPYSRVITPNIPEAEILLGKKIEKQEDLPTLAKELSQDRKVSVLLKAGHLVDEELIDIFYNAEEDETVELKSRRVHTPNTHGTGCTLSSAMAAFIAQGLSLNEAAREAKNYINNAIIEGAKYEIGKGHGPVHHFHKFWK